MMTRANTFFDDGQNHQDGDFHLRGRRFLQDEKHRDRPKDGELAVNSMT